GGATDVETRCLTEEQACFVVALLRHGLELSEGVLEGDVDDLGAAEGDHATPLLVDHGLERRHPEARREHAVVAGGGSTALNVTERCRPGLDSRALLDHGREQLADAS